MRTSIDSYTTRAAKLATDDLDLGSFADRPLSPQALRCLRYMHDVEHHTVCYLRDLLLTPAHRDPDVTAFLSCWVFEELWHGEAIGAVLAAHGEPSGATRVGPMRRRHRWRDTASLVTKLGAGALAGESFVALHMSWGAVNEWTTQAGYARLASLEGHPLLAELLRRSCQEGRHIDYYAAEAGRRLEGDRRAQRVTRAGLAHLWRPVGRA